MVIDRCGSFGHVAPKIKKFPGSDGGAGDDGDGAVGVISIGIGGEGAVAAPFAMGHGWSEEKGGILGTSFTRAEPPLVLGKEGFGVGFVFPVGEPGVDAPVGGDAEAVAAATTEQAAETEAGNIGKGIGQWPAGHPTHLGENPGAVDKTVEAK